MLDQRCARAAIELRGECHISREASADQFLPGRAASWGPRKVASVRFEKPLRCLRLRRLASGQATDHRAGAEPILKRRLPSGHRSCAFRGGAVIREWIRQHRRAVARRDVDARRERQHVDEHDGVADRGEGFNTGQPPLATDVERVLRERFRAWLDAQGRYDTPCPGPSCVFTTRHASSMKSTSNGRVSRGSIISSMPKACALRNGDEIDCSRASIS